MQIYKFTLQQLLLITLVRGAIWSQRNQVSAQRHDIRNPNEKPNTKTQDRRVLIPGRVHFVDGARVLLVRQQVASLPGNQLYRWTKAHNAKRGGGRQVSATKTQDQEGVKLTKTLRNYNGTLYGVDQQQHGKSQFAVVVDCGSSGTRAQIYRWPQGALRSSLPSQAQALREPQSGKPLSHRIRPGLSSVRDNPEAASEYLRPIMQFASQHVPVELQRTAPVYILGTAGLRTLTSTERNNILEDILRDLRLEFRFQNLQAEVISGLDEGFYQWLSINSLGRRLDPRVLRAYDQAQEVGFYRQSARSRRYGLVEMGGVSAQVAFEVSPMLDELVGHQLKHQPEAWRAYKALRATVSLSDANNNERMSVFSVSFLGFGSDNARQWAIDLIVRDSIVRLRQGAMLPFVYQANSTLVVEDPCLPKDSEDQVMKPASLLYNPSKTIGYPEPRPQDQTIQVRLVGSGNFAQCQALLQRLIVASKAERATCQRLDQHGICDAPLIGTNFLPWRHLQFLGLGDLYYTSHEMLHASGQFNGPLVLFESMQVCSRSLAQLNQVKPASSEFERRRNLLACFKASWIVQWLSVALRMPMDGFSLDLTTTDRVNDEEIDWKLGAVITKALSGGSL